MLNNVVAFFNGVGVPPSTNSYESIATVTVGSGGSSSISFSSIPSTYKHLQIRLIARSTRVNVGDYINIRYNSDSGTNYSYHVLNADGSGAGASAGSTQNGQYWGRVAAANAGSNVFGGGVIDVLDYANTNKNKTARGLVSYDNNGSGELYFNSGAWYSTSAINAITITCNNDFAQYSSFALYGIKG